MSFDSCQAEFYVRECSFGDGGVKETRKIMPCDKAIKFLNNQRDYGDGFTYQARLVELKDSEGHTRQSFHWHPPSEAAQKIDQFTKIRFPDQT